MRIAPRRLIAALSLLAAAVALVASTAAAQTAGLFWSVQPAESRIDIVYVEDGVAKPGRFARFEGAGRFDPRNPGRAALELTIDVRSLDLDDGFREELVLSDGWFDGRTHPKARFRLASLTPIEGERYRAEGDLTIKAITRPITAEVTIAIDGRRATATGAASFDRVDFTVGDTLGGFLVEIDRRIEVRFAIVATTPGG